MRGISLYLLSLLAASISFGNSFFVSEIYANTVGKGLDKNKEWIEIVNRSNSEIAIKNLALEIYSGKKTEPVFRKSISFANEPIVFFDYLLIAQAKNLGLNHCLNENIKTIVVPGFSIANDQEQRLCITLNDDEKSCVMTSKKMKTKDGVALFHDRHASNDAVWFYEPCHLVDGIFATPGFFEKACLENVNFRDEILKDCTSVEMAVHSMEAGHAPIISSTEISHGEKTATLKISYADEDKDDIWWVSFCTAKKDSKKICHKTDFKQVTSGLSYTFPLPSTFSDEKDQYYFLLHDLNGSVVTIKTTETESSTSAQSRWHPHMVLDRLRSSQPELILLLSDNDLPLNVFLFAADGRMIDQRSFVERGEKKIVMNNKETSYLNLSNASGNVVIDL